MQLWDSLEGIVDAEITSAELESTLKALNVSGIGLSHLRYQDEMTCHVRIYRKDLPALRSIFQKRGEKLRILQRRGIFWKLKQVPSRPVLLAGFLFLFAVTLLLPTRVLFVQVEGNQSIPQSQILEAAENCGICFGASRQKVRSEKVKNALLFALPQLQWAGVNTAGCVATVSIRERSEPEQEKREYPLSNIIASRDGYILHGTTTQGSQLFQPGQAVREGQILISGYLDHGICIQGTQAAGEVFAETNRDLEAITPMYFQYRGQIIGRKQKISILFRKKRINLWKDSGISGMSCDRMYKEYYLTLPGGFVLPLGLCVEVFADYTMETQKRPQEEVYMDLENFASVYLQQQMVAGTIRNQTQTISSEDGTYHLSGKYICEEMIGREQHEQIGEQNGKSS